MSRVLCPVDFSESSLNAIEYAANVASRMKTSLLLINIFTEEEFNAVVSSTQINRSFKDALSHARSKLETIAAEVTKRYTNIGLVTCESEVVLGDLYTSLLDKSKELDIEYVVVGTTGVGKRPMMGSNTSHLIKKCEKPLICVPRKAVYSGFNKVVYATDIHESDKVIIQNVVSFSLIFNSRIYVLHLTGKKEKLEREETNNFFDELKSFIQYPKITFESRNYEGNLSAALLSYMEENQCDLLAVYSKIRGNLDSLFHKSIAKELSVISNKPLMILK